MRTIVHWSPRAERWLAYAERRRDMERAYEVKKIKNALRTADYRGRKRREARREHHPWRKRR